MQSYKVKDLFSAINEGNYEKVKSILEYGVDPNITDEKGGYALMRACESEGTEDTKCKIVELLLDKKADVNSAHTKTGRTALHGAVVFNFVQLAQLLLKKGAEVDLRDKSSFKATPLIFCAEFNENSKSIELLIKGKANVNALSERNSEDTLTGGCMTALHISAYAGAMDNFAMLLRLGADTSLKTDLGKSVVEGLEHACKFNIINKKTLEHGLELLKNSKSQDRLVEILGKINLNKDDNPLRHVIGQQSLEIEREKIISLLKERKFDEGQIKMGFETALIKYNLKMIDLFEPYLKSEHLEEAIKSRMHLFSSIIEEQQRKLYRFERLEQYLNNEGREQDFNLLGGDWVDQVSELVMNEAKLTTETLTQGIKNLEKKILDFKKYIENSLKKNSQENSIVNASSFFQPAPTNPEFTTKEEEKVYSNMKK